MTSVLRQKYFLEGFVAGDQGSVEAPLYYLQVLNRSCLKILRLIPVKYSRCFFLLVNQSLTQRLTRIPQNNESRIPMICVVANPFTGPNPKMKRMIAVNNVVTCASSTGGKERR